MHMGAKVGIRLADVRRSVKVVQASEPLLLVVALLSTSIIFGGCTGVVNASKSAAPTTGAFQLSPTALNFGNIVVGKQSTQTVTISNPGTASLTIMQATVSNPQFTVTGMTLPMTMTSGQSANITVGVKPTAAGTLSGTLTVQGDSGSGSGTVNLTATATATNPQISLSSSSINFGSVVTGSSGSSNLTISNTGSADLTVTAVSITGTGFGVSGITTPKVITAGQSSALSLTFNPTATGAASGSLTIGSSDPANPTLHVSLSGTGATAPAGTLQPNQTSLSFGNVSTGSNSVKQVVVTNAGTSPVQITAVGVTGTGFAVSGATTPMTLNASSQVTLSVTFAPTTAGNASGTVSVTSNASGSPLAIPVSGTGVQPGLTISPASFNFGSVVSGQTKSQTFTVTNSGTASLTISQLSISAAGYSVGGLSVPLPSTVAPSSSVTFSAVFAPTTVGSLSGTVNILSNAPNSPASVALSGTGVAQTQTLSFSSTNIGFGSVNTGTSATQSETIANTGNSNVQISTIVANGTGYSLSGAGAPVTLSPSQNLTFSVIFDPLTAGSASGSILVTSNATGSPTTISLTGSGVQAASHTVSLTWVASTTSTVTGYNVYRSTITGSGYVKVGSASGLSYTDSTVQNAITYYYVTTAVDSIGDESIYSNEAAAVIP